MLGKLISAFLLLQLIYIPSAQAVEAPTCFGKPATHVFLPPGDTRDFEGAEETVAVATESPYFFGGSFTRDVMFAFEATGSAGHIPAPWEGLIDVRSTLPGDIVCGSPGTDSFYLSSNPNALDKVDPRSTSDGNDFIYNHGGPLFVKASPGIQRIWTGRLNRDSTAVINGGKETDHLYAGRGSGKVIFNGGPGFDHLHPCINGEPATHEYTEAEFEAEFPNFDVSNVEYIGPEGPHVPGGFVGFFDPCLGTS